MLIDIKITWKKNRTWGMNPHAEVRVWGKGDEFHSVTTRTSGYGYDKTSTVVATALNQVKFLQTYLLAHRSELDGLYGLNWGDNRVDWSAGVGITCFHAIIEKLGGKVIHADAPTWDYIRYELPANEEKLVA